MPVIAPRILSTSQSSFPRVGYYGDAGAGYFGALEHSSRRAWSVIGLLTKSIHSWGEEAIEPAAAIFARRICRRTI
jgi:hypothetical protein